jgi:predicted dehydrogenase
MGTVRWGLLSTANINRRLIPAIQASQRGQLLAVASRTQSTADAYAAEWDIPHAFGGYQAMLDSDLIDAVYIGLPNHLHAEWSIRAMQAGKHVLCEKPFALTLDEVDAMIEACHKYQRILAEAFMYRHHPQTKIAGEWVHSGRIGEPIVVRSVFNFLLSNRNDVRLIPEYGGGSLWDVGVYPMSFAQFIFNSPPIAVDGFQWIGDSGIDETFVGQMLYPGGGLAQISSSFRSPFHIHAEVIGTEGRLTLTRPFNVMEAGRQMCFYALDNEPVEIPVPEVELYSGEVNDMHAAILDGAPSYLTLMETRNHIRTVLALYEAANKNQRISL